MFGNENLRLYLDVRNAVALELVGLGAHVRKNRMA